MRSGVSPFSVRKFLPHIAKKHCGRTFLCFRNALVERIFWIGGVSQFCQSFSSQIAEKHRGRTLLCFWDVLVSKVFWIVGVSRFCQPFLSHSTEKLRRGTLVFRQCSGTEKFLDYELSWFCWNFLSHVAENHRRRNVLCFKVIVVSNFFG